MRVLALNAGSSSLKFKLFDINHGGTLNIAGMLFVNGCSSAHILLEAARCLNRPPEDLLVAGGLSVLVGKAAPQGVIF